MEKSLTQRLTRSYMLIAIICVLLISIFANVFLEEQFQDYKITNQQKKHKAIAVSIANGYTLDGEWNLDVVQNIGVEAMGEGVIIKVMDNSGTIIWDAMEYNYGICQSMMSQMSQNMIKRYPSWNGKYVENTYSILVHSEEVGMVKIGYYGPFYYTDDDLMFLRTLNKIILIVGALSLLLAFILGIIMAGSLSKPISRVIGTAHMIEKANYGERINEKSNIKEINELTSTINNLAENLQSQESLRKRLTADVAHELRTPITTLQSHMEAIIDGVWEPTMERIISCHEEILRMKGMVGDIENLARYESENLVLNKSHFDISQLIKNILINFEREFKNKGIEICFNGNGHIIFADRDRISQVVINLISNGLKYTKEGGRVEIDVKDNHDNMELTVKDSGIGISEEDIPFIFERFYRADKSRCRLTGGAGIGLAITKAIVEAHKGNITVHSKLNEGAEFKMTLPKTI